MNAPANQFTLTIDPHAHARQHPQQQTMEKQAGHIINVSSVLGRLPFPTYRSTYCARSVSH